MGIIKGRIDRGIRDEATPDGKLYSLSALKATFFQGPFLLKRLITPVIVALLVSIPRNFRVSSNMIEVLCSSMPSLRMYVKIMLEPNKFLIYFSYSRYKIHNNAH
ncbi:MAG: hypothetical protein PWQ60_1569 [Thermoanaerobacteraceae bacterium]|jgi:hypothetical protein|nr:hypothetical protein [Thermoanaerobacteraceae bacterium]